MDWLIDKMEAAGYRTVIEIGNTDPEGIMTMYPGSHSWLGKDIKTAGRSQQSLLRRYRTLIVIGVAAAGSVASVVGMTVLLLRQKNRRSERGA